MTDFRLAYSTEEVERVNAYVERTTVTCASLGLRYLDLQHTAAAGRRGDGQPSAPRSPGSRVPIRLEFIDASREIEDFAGKYLLLTRAALKLKLQVSDLGETVVERTGVRLTRLGGYLGPLFNASPVLGEEVARHVWRLWNHAGRVLGLGSVAFRISDPCGKCGEESLWVDPSTFRIGCGMPECRAVWPIDAPVPVAETSTPAVTKT